MGLKVNKTLTSINLRYNKIGDAGAEKIAEALKVNKTLTSINLRDNKIGDAGAEKIAEALKVNKTLTSLNLRENGIGSLVKKKIAEMLEANKSLASVKGHNRNDSGAEQVAQAVAATLEKLDTDHIVVRQNRVTKPTSSDSVTHLDVDYAALISKSGI